MRILSVPVLILGIALLMVGLGSAFAPEVLAFSAGNIHVFELVPRVPAGLTITLAGALMIWEGCRGSRHYLGLFLGVLASLFFAVASFLPAFLGDKFIPFGPFVFREYVNGVTTTMWLATAALCGYYYIRLRLEHNRMP